MKCIRCGTENNLQDRTANRGRCKNCSHPFVFEPTAMDAKLKFTDPFFAKALSDISVNNTLHFTPQQLFYFLEKRLKKKAIAADAGGTIGCGAVLIFLSFPFWQLGIGWLLMLIGLIVAILGFFRSRKSPQYPRDLVITQSMVDDWLTRWTQINSVPEKLLTPALPSSISSNINSEITNYSFDRLVVCDSEAIAQMLIANNFHFENNCAILTISGYPQSIFETTMQMVYRNPQLLVYALHNCSCQGVELAHQLRTSPNWFGGRDIAIIDVGILPRQVLAAKRNIFIENNPNFGQISENISPEVRQTLSETELEWLKAGNFVELESFTPQALIQILNRSIATSREANIEEGGLIVIGDSGGYIYATDSFG